MTKKTQRLHQFAKLPLAVAVAATMSTPASAFQFYMGDLEASFDTTLTAGASWRVSERDNDLVGEGSGGNGGSINSDDGNLNFDKNDTYSKIIKGNSDFLLRGDGWGVFARAKYWYDFELKDENRATDANGYQRNLSKDGKDNASGGEVLDACIYKDFYFGDMPLNMRIGKQVVSWGESTFILNGINVINPIDVQAFRAPGAEVKDALIPVNMVYGSLGLTDNVTLEAFVQLEYEKTRIDDCGTYFSTVDYVADGCGPVYGVNAQSEQFNQLGLDGLGLMPTQLSRMGDDEPDDTDQFGLAVRWYVPELNDSELGFYFVQYHSRVPLIAGVVASNPDLGGNGSDKFPEYFMEYPEAIQMVGVSFNTSTESGYSIGGEVSYKKDLPLQWNSFELIHGGLGVPSSLLYQREVAEAGGDETQLADFLTRGERLGPEVSCYGSGQGGGVGMFDRSAGRVE